MCQRRGNDFFIGWALGSSQQQSVYSQAAALIHFFLGERGERRRTKGPNEVQRTGLKSVCPPNVERGIMDVRNHGIFLKKFTCKSTFCCLLASFWGMGENIIILFPVFLLRAAANPPHHRDRHLCSQELVLGPRTWQEASENKTEVPRGEIGEGCFPTACEGTSYLGMRDPRVHF